MLKSQLSKIVKSAKSISKEKMQFRSLKDKHLNFGVLENQISSTLSSLNKFYKKMDDLPIRTDVKPGFIYDKYISDFPQEPQAFDSVLNQLEKDVFPNTCLWQHPGFFAYYAASTSHNAITLEMLSTAMHTPNFNWNVSPAGHELEWVVMDWIVKMLDFGEKFTFDKGGCGGTVNSTTEGIFLSVNHAKHKKVNELKLSARDPRRLDFVAYYPYTNKDWAEKVLRMKDICIQRCMPVYYNEETQNFNIDPEELKMQIEQDIKEGLIPFWYGGQIGATNCGSCDQVEIIGPILKEHKIYYNLDAAHAGFFSILPEYRIKGMKYVNNVVLNLAKAGLCTNVAAINFNDDKESLVYSTGNIDGEIYRTENEGIKMNYKDLSVGFSKRMVGIKLYGMMKTIGVSGYQEFLRNMIQRGDYFLSLLEKNERFELFVKPSYGLVCFRLKPLTSTTMDAYNEVNSLLLKKMNQQTEFGYISSTSINGMKFLRFVSGNANSEYEHVDKLWNFMEECAEEIDI